MGLVTIYGDNFINDPQFNKVLFPPNIEAPILEISGNRILTVVPENATKGRIRLVSGLFADTSREVLNIYAQQETSVRILSFFPSKIKSGGHVKIAGSGFSSQPNGNLVYFGAVKAGIVKFDASTQELDVVVPDGIQQGSLTVVRVSDHTASASVPYEIYLAQEDAPPMFCIVRLKSLQVYFQDYESCGGKCPQEIERNGCVSMDFYQEFRRAKDSIFVAQFYMSGKKDTLILQDNKLPELVVRSLVMVGEEEHEIDRCDVFFTVKAILGNITLYNEEDSVYTATGNAMQYTTTAFELLETGGNFRHGGCGCSCTSHPQKIVITPNTRIDIQLIH